MQLSINFDAPPLSQARAAGDIGMQRAQARAERDEPGFSQRAEALIIEKLKHGPASGEACTDYVRAAGLRMADGRALGWAYQDLISRGVIVRVGECPRARGHGTRGGSIYALAGKAA